MSSTSDPPCETADIAAPIILDFDHLRQQTLGDETLEADLLTLFSHQARSILEDLTAKDPDAITTPSRRAELLHLLCGSARAVGAWDVALHAQTLEGEARGNAATRHPAPGVPALAHAVQRVCETIDRTRAAASDPHPSRPAATRR